MKERNLELGYARSEGPGPVRLVPPDSHLVTKMIDVETLVGQPVFERGEVFEEQFPRQGLVPALVIAGNVGSEINTVGLGDQVTREYALSDVVRSVYDGSRQVYE